MKFSSVIFLLALLPSCSLLEKHKEQAPQPNNHVAELRQKDAIKRAELALLLDASGYPQPAVDCDLTLWVGKACAAGVKVNISKVEYSSGEIGRRPPPSCWESDGLDHGSASTVSNDMMTGYLACLWKTKDVAAIQRLAAYGEAHKVTFPIPGWQMGEPYPDAATRVVMRPNGIGLVGRMLEAMTGGAVMKNYRDYPAVFGPTSADYEGHLQAEDIYQNGVVNEELQRQSLDAVPAQTPGLIDINGVELERLQSLVDGDPTNPFFHAVLGVYSGDMSVAISLLLDDTTPVPTYVRGQPQHAYELIHWLRASQVVLDRFPPTVE